MISIPRLFGQSIRPPERVSVAEWADDRRVLPSTSAEPGPWRTSRTPYMREPMEAMTPGSDVREITIMSAAQVGKTELILNAIGHSIEVDPGPSLIVQPTMETAKSWSRKRLKPMIESTPSLDGLFGDSKRNPKNTLSYKEWPGGFLRIGYATSAAELASDPIRYVFGDEIDKWPSTVDGEGDPVELAAVRTRTFRGRERKVWVSTPSIEGHSRIKRLYDEGDQRRYHLPCPCCDAFFVPELDMLERVGSDAAALECPECDTLIDESEKTGMLAAGEWRATNENAPPGVRSYHLSAIIAPAGWISWVDILDEHDRAQEADDNDALQVFYNAILGLPYERREAEKPDWNRVYARRGGCELGEVPVDAVVLTSGVDVQKDRLECEVVAWGPDMRSWSVEYLVFPGDPSQPDVWRDLDGILYERWPGEQGAEYRISRMAVDTGYLTDEVYRWARRRGPRLVMPVKGSTAQTATIGKPTRPEVDAGGKRVKSSAYLWKINVDNLKEQVMRWVQLDVPEPGDETPRGWCEFPNYAPEYFKGLCGEQRVLKRNRFVWEVVYKDQEPLDCRVYATAAAQSLGIDRWSERRWQREQSHVVAASKEGDEVRRAVRGSRATESDGKKRKRRRSKSSYLER